MRGVIFNIQRCCLHDGYGVRTTVFLKGCGMRCRWCCNPEGLSPFPETMDKIDKVDGKTTRRKVTVGEYYTVDEIMAEIIKDRNLFDTSGGGVTFSGGEPMMQDRFLLAVLMKCREEAIHTAIETDGYASEMAFQLVSPYTDLFLYDIKHVNSDKHQLFTGVPSTLIQSNLAGILEMNISEVRLRMAVIPTFNESDADVLEIAKHLRQYSYMKLKMDIMAYHTGGVRKYDLLDKPYPMPINIKSPTKERMEQIKMILETEGGLEVNINS